RRGPQLPETAPRQRPEVLPSVTIVIKEGRIFRLHQVVEIDIGNRWRSRGCVAGKRGFADCTRAYEVNERGGLRDGGDPTVHLWVASIQTVPQGAITGSRPAFVMTGPAAGDRRNLTSSRAASGSLAPVVMPAANTVTR